MRIALLQLKGSKDKPTAVQNAVAKIKQMVREYKPLLIVLPESFNCPYGSKYFREYAETVPDGSTCQQLSQLAKEHGVYIVGGSVIERSDNDTLYNTCTIWDPNGELIAKHRKVHLFDNDIRNSICFKESENLSPGSQFTIIEVDGHKIGIGICYDMFFEEMARVYRNAGCEMLIYPAAFHITTGPPYWELLQRARATDNQVFVVTTSPARDETADYVAYGHSMIVDPWAKVVKSAKEGEETIVADIDFSLVEQVRQQIPLFTQRRLDLYGTERKH